MTKKWGTSNRKSGGQEGYESNIWVDINQGWLRVASVW